ncbi:Spx/MgsR family RNA polymerase-binding regulatory protein [Mucilaginibacter lappiensis]|uniref:Spx/MgsR family RNA polymerase-binding regulatory protein n=1 Tax=Mucilaginibacter lappiensis TaxID=354630 RepID=UPI003D228617
MKVYGQTTCRRTQKALAWFKERKMAIEFQNFKKDGVSSDKLQEWDAKMGYDAFLNKKSTTWRKLHQEVKESIKTKEDALRLLKDQPGIIKRPVIEDGNFLFFGFDEMVYEDHFKKPQNQISLSKASRKKHILL